VRPDAGGVMRAVIILVSAQEQQAATLPSGSRLGTFLEVYYRLRDGGAEIVLASTNGGFPWPDLAREDEDASTPETQRFRQDRAARDEFNDTLRLDQICVADFDAGFCIGGVAFPAPDHAASPEAGLAARLLALGKPVAVIGAVTRSGANGVQNGHLITARTAEAALFGVEALLGSPGP
jgi:putative intracellular protease/amidase